MNLALLLCVLLQDDPPVIVPNIDSAVRSIQGYALPKEAKVAGDEVFLKRVMRDLVDAVPSDDEVQVFVNDRDPKKRSKMINGLLADDRFGATWAKRWEAVFFVDVQQNPWTQLPLSTDDRKQLVETFTKWLAVSLRREKPWTEIVTNMLDSRGTTEGDPAMAWLLSLRRGKGFEREFAEAAARNLLGVRIGCARCHDHPYEAWNVEQYYGMAAFVVRQRARLANGSVELKYSDDGEMRSDSDTKEFPPKFLYGGTAGKHDDRMKVLAGLMTAKTDPQLPRALVNRVWSWLFGSGIVNPVDDFTTRHAPLSQPLLDALVKTTVENNYSVKHLVRVICNTQAYQMPTPSEAPDAESFRHLAVRKNVPRAYPPAPEKPPALPVSFELPQAWIRVKPPTKTLALYLIPHKDDPSRTVELGLYQGAPPEQPWTMTGKMDPMKSLVMPVEGKGRLKVTWTEQTGANWCRLEAEGPVEWRLWVVSVDTAKPVHFRLGGPADLLDAWRADFRLFLESMSKK